MWTSRTRRYNAKLVELICVKISWILVRQGLILRRSAWTNYILISLSCLVVQTIITRDNVEIGVHPMLVYEIVDPIRVAYEVRCIALRTFLFNRHDMKYSDIL